MSTATLEMPGKRTNRGEGDAVPEGVDRIVLTGFMGSGKSTAGALLAERLGWAFVDLDREIERKEGRPVPRIFSESGELHFRHLETAALAALLGQRRLVVALGGGAPEELGNRLLLEQTPHTAVVYLSAAYATLLERCVVQARDPGAVERPVLADLGVAEERYELRRPQYERIASHCVETTELGIGATVDAILNALRGDG